MKLEKPQYYQLIPDKIYQNFPGIEDLIRPAIPGYSSDYLKEIISLIACHTRKNKTAAQLQINYIRKMVPHGDKYLKALIALKFVERSGKAIVGERSYNYKFVSDYQSKYISLPLNNAKLIRRIKESRIEIKKNASKSLRGLSEQIKCLKLLTIDPAYINFINSNCTTESNQYNCAIASITRIINGDITYSVDNTSQRFHSNVTNMAKGMRQFLRIKDQPLITIDIKNSQPYLSTILLTNPSKITFLINNSAFAILTESLYTSNKQDVKNYISLVVSGNIYEYLMSEFLKEGLELTRNETKIQVLRILFARNRMPKDITNKRARQIFKERFPTVHRIFSKIRGSAKGDKFTSYKRFAILLQRIESYLLLNVILKRIHKELSNSFILTIHDSILTTADNIEAICKIMREELTLFVGFEPKLTIERNI